MRIDRGPDSMPVGRRRIYFAIGLLFAVATLGQGLDSVSALSRPSQLNNPGATLVEQATKVEASVGRVRNAGSWGTGWIAAPSTVVTNLHVARAGSSNIYIDFSDGASVECYAAVADRDMDLAVLRCPTAHRAALRIDPAIPDAGTPVAVVGYPLGQGPIDTYGVITGERIKAHGIDTIGFTAVIKHGNSGSPVFDARGEVRGVATFGGGLGVPIGELMPLLSTASHYPATKAGAEWQVRIRRSAIVGSITLLVAWFLARRYSRNSPWKVGIRWAIGAIVVVLVITQALFAIHGPVTFI